ncbi:hypothetical protein [Hyphomonas sp. ND6WE1B]|jgi:hypothetical protein|uniref:hypothetical protein n=1 Tax=Hyphomonas sp. ND6WE1B TaxID=1848191 RepID=UPI0009F3044C|nr:hypothetical protein [Hyphomonas sp. ND6WE1B]
MKPGLLYLMGLALLSLGACAGGSGMATSGSPIPELSAVPDYEPPRVARLDAHTVRDWPAPEADQGVVVDEAYFYALDNTIIGKYRRDNGELVARFAAPHKGLIRHMNSCHARQERLWCANSNYSLTPHGSSVEVFDAETMTHTATHSLGMMDEGSLTWFDTWQGGWIAGFAHYSGNGGVPFKDSTYSSIVTFDKEWRRTGGWLIPDSVIDRMAPHAASGGALGPDGLLYLMGHDRPEMYVMARPVMGPTLIHVATLALEAEGQAFSFTQDGTRHVFVIDRHKARVREIELPPLADLPPGAERF